MTVALKLTKTMRDGSTAEYWKVGTVFHFDVVNKTAGASLLLYVNETARRADRLSVPIPNVECATLPPPPQLTGQPALDALASGDPRAALYALLKVDPYFAGAEDV
jgi:hypothetical protein